MIKVSIEQHVLKWMSIIRQNSHKNILYRLLILIILCLFVFLFHHEEYAFTFIEIQHIRRSQYLMEHLVLPRSNRFQLMQVTYAQTYLIEKETYVFSWEFIYNFGIDFEAYRSICT